MTTEDQFTAIENAQRDGRLPTLDELGGRSALLKNAAELAGSRFADVIATLACQEGGVDADLAMIALSAVVITKSPVVFRATLAQLGSAQLPSEFCDRLQSALLERVRDRFRDARAALIAAYALEGLLTLATANIVSKYRLLSSITELRANEPDGFAPHAAKIAGVAFRCWGERDLIATLEKLSQVEPAAAEALTELALCELHLAFSESDPKSIFARLETSRATFARALAHDAEREDARTYLNAVEIVLAFTTDKRVDASLSESLRQSADKWLGWRERDLLPEWVHSRQDSDLQWFALCRLVESVANQLDRPSWLNASAVLSQVLEVYRADFTVGTGRGLRAVVEPRIEAAFLLNAGLRSHLDDALAAGVLDRVSEEQAMRLRTRLQQSSSDAGESPGKTEEGGRFMRLAAVLNDRKLLESLPPDAASQIESFLAAYEEMRSIAHPIVQQLFAAVRDSLSTNPDYSGKVKKEVDNLCLLILTFCKSRLDARITDRTAYLSDPDAVEGSLQRDLLEYLRGNCLWAEFAEEIPGVATGRTDIYVTADGFRRYVIELKREKSDCSRAGLRKYLNQTIAYQVTNVRIGFLGVLDLVSREGPAPHLLMNVWTDEVHPTAADPRSAIVFRVIGNLRRPSDYS